MTAAKAYLEGGPAALPERIVPITHPGIEVKIQYRGGYEHFTATPRHADTEEGRLPVFQWSYRTAIAE
ncbi:DUF5988 family protein [Nocardia sp. CDC159]|uniref:DUF5988 family protein n=1 Tax=Nocardia pulmonis TaxID=2951408 RepID=A0A9X2E340_9NOCA|nr:MULTISPECIES: DUF5988 family protein [Nocardia]MCM6773252.1 DUF5988 family protein [Nocardia pulmonis]MCM6786139.1 DUF5988 family protein [Nocardia sp. CDC159]